MLITKRHVCKIIKLKDDIKNRIKSIIYRIINSYGGGRGSTHGSGGSGGSSIQQYCTSVGCLY